MPASTAYRARTADGAQLGRELVAWTNALTNGWPAVRFRRLSVTRNHDAYAFQVQVELGAIDPDFVGVELYAENAADAARIPMTREEGAVAGTFIYRADVPALRPATDYTPRVIPLHGSALVPLEINLIRWYDGPR